MTSRSPYCRGCGHAQVAQRLAEAIAELALPPTSVVVTTDIGCVGLADSRFPDLHTVHAIHGRSTAIAAGMALAEAALGGRALKPVVMIGDGGAMIGLVHLVHAAQLDVDITVLLHNNFLFGMTGGQNSATTPLDLRTATTPEGSSTPPLDFAEILRAANAGWLARTFATDAALGPLLVEAIAHPGFSLIEILEFCPTHHARLNRATGASVHEWARSQGLELGRIPPRPGPRSTFRERLEARALRPPAGPIAEERAVDTPAPSPRAAGPLAGELRLVVAGSAGERVQSAASLLCRAALACGLYSTQKNDNPVTQGTGFSLSEVCLGEGPIDYTGMDRPDAVVVVSQEGLDELQANGTLDRCIARTLIVIDDTLEAPAQGLVHRLPLRRVAGARWAALAGLVACSAIVSGPPPEGWWAAVAGAPPDRRPELEAAVRAGHDLAATVARGGGIGIPTEAAP